MREIVCLVAEIFKFSGGPIETAAFDRSTSHFAHYTVTYMYYFVV